MNNNIRIIAEWEEQDAVIISWPHKATDWAYMLREIDECYKNIAKAILRYEDLIILTPEVERVKSIIKEVRENSSEDTEHSNKCFVIEMKTNDTWVRDYGPISYEMDIDDKKIKAIADFTFNGWGMKYASNYDNLVNRCLYLSKSFAGDVSIMNRLILSLEGGAIESDGKGTILTTSSVIFEPNRNAGFSNEDLLDVVSDSLGAKRILTLDRGYLTGDDTDGHIDTLARFISEDTIVYTCCDDPNDEHYHELKLMKEELEKLVDNNGDKYKLIPIPLPKAIFDEEGNRLPATYANFLMVNNAIIVPTYNQDYDGQVIKTLEEALPTRSVVAVDCNALIKQHGSLHCATMQIPRGFINRNKFN